MGELAVLIPHGPGQLDSSRHRSIFFERAVLFSIWLIALQQDGSEHKRSLASGSKDG